MNVVQWCVKGVGRLSSLAAWFSGCTVQLGCASLVEQAERHGLMRRLCVSL
jgi:hypothetical protein